MYRFLLMEAIKAGGLFVFCVIVVGQRHIVGEDFREEGQPHGLLISQSITENHIPGNAVAKALSHSTN